MIDYNVAACSVWEGLGWEEAKWWLMCQDVLCIEIGSVDTIFLC